MFPPVTEIAAPSSVRSAGVGPVTLAAQPVDEVDLLARRDLAVIGRGDDGVPIGIGLRVDPVQDPSEGRIDVPQHRKRLRRSDELVMV